MNFRPSFYLIAGCLLLSLTLKAQNNLFNNHGLPLKSLESPAFGNDIVIHDHPERNQRNVTVCSAFNGWLYAAYTYSVGIQGACSVLKSTDGGLTWNVLIEGPNGLNHVGYSKIDMVARGTNPDDIKLFLVQCYYDSLNNRHFAAVVIIDGNTGEPFDDILQEGQYQVKDVAIATDYPFTAAGANPNSIAIIYSKHNVTDSIIFRSSSNGGEYFDYYKGVAGTSGYFGQVALSYGHSPFYSEGRYFGCWLEKQSEFSATGHIYTAYNTTGFNSPFTPPVCLDSLDPSTINNLRLPKISCQNSNFNNDSLNLSDIILCESYNQQSQDFDIKGYYTENAITSSGEFRTFTLPSKHQPDIAFNFSDSSFMMTYYDSINKKLPYLTTHMNFLDPLIWNVLSSGYNDEINLEDPVPKIRPDYGTMTGMNAWIKEGGNEKGVALFDAPFRYYTDVRPPITCDPIFINVYPNPSSGPVTFEFSLSQKETVRISILSDLGQELYTRLVKYDQGGICHEKIDLSGFETGIYIYNVENSNGIARGKLIINH